MIKKDQVFFRIFTKVRFQLVQELLHPVEGNEVFLRLPEGVRERMNARGFLFVEGDWTGALSGRLVTAFNTQQSEVDAFLAALREELHSG